MWWVGWRVGRGEGGGVGICMHAMSFVFGHETARGGWYNRVRSGQRRGAVWGGKTDSGKYHVYRDMSVMLSLCGWNAISVYDYLSAG